MTDAELLKLKPAELIAALNDKEIMSLLRKDSALVQHALDVLGEKELAETFVKNKFAPKEAISKYPLSFIEQFSELNFNPGTDGILDLCGYSKSVKIDRAISKLLGTFPTNKYDAAFLRGVMNLSSSEGVILNETLSTLLQDSSVNLIFLNDLKEENPAAFMKVILGLKGDVRASAGELLTKDFVTRLEEKETMLLPLFRLIIELDRGDLLDSDWNHSPFIELFQKTNLSKISDDEAMYFFQNSKCDNSYRTRELIIPYRPIFEELSRENGFSRMFSNVPRKSKFFINAFALGNETLPASEAYAFLGAYSRQDLLGRILASGSDSEMAIEIRKNPERLISFIESHSIKPAALRDAISRGRPEVAAAILELVGSDFRKQILSNYSDLKKESGKTPIGEKHAQICGLISSHDGQGFMEEILTYEKGQNSVEGNLTYFLARHSQSTYEKKYENLSLSHEFLKKLKDEPVAMRLILSKIKTSAGYGGDKKGKAFLSAKNAFLALEEDKEYVSDALRMTYEPEKFLDLLSEKQLSEISFDYEEKTSSKSLDQIANLLVKLAKANPGRQKVELKSDVILRKVASLMTKAECSKAFRCDPFEGYDTTNFQLVFKDGERFTAKDLLKSAKTISSYRIDDVMLALESIGATEELKVICEAIVAPKATAFSDLFPAAGNRSSDLRQKATKILSGINPASVDVRALIKKSNKFSALAPALGDQFVEMLMKNETTRSPNLIIDSPVPNLSKTELETLMQKYTVKAPTVLIQTQEDIRRLGDYIALGIEVDVVTFQDNHYYYNREKLDLRLISEGIRLALTKPEIRIEVGTDLFKYARMEGCSGLLTAHTIMDLQSKVKDLESLKNAHALDLPMASSEEIAERVASNADMLKYAINEGIRFEGFTIAVGNYDFERTIKKLIPEAAKIGLTIVTEDEFRCLTVYSHVFAKDGSIKDFEPISLAALEMSDRVELVKLLTAQNPKYKKLLSQNLSSNQFILNPPQLLDKAILNLANMKDLLGFGIPGDLSKEEKGSLADLIIASGSLLSLAVTKTKSFLAMGNLNEIRFEDIFVKNGSKVTVSEFALFMATRFETIGDGAEALFASIVKSPSKLEMFSLLKDDQEGDFTSSFLKDSITALETTRSDINRFIALLGESDISATLILAAMAGDSGANAALDARMTQGDDGADMLKELSNAVKIVTVTLSIARKQAKAGDNVNLARILHDSLGGLSQTTKSILADKGEVRKKKMKTGFEKYNEKLAAANMAISSTKNDKKYTIYFPYSLEETRKIGAENTWCTKYNDSYFDATIGGEAVLFNIKDGEKIVAQGYAMSGKGKSWIMSQLRYNNNSNAEKDFDCDSIITLLQDIIRRDEKLQERYML